MSRWDRVSERIFGPRRSTGPTKAPKPTLVHVGRSGNRFHETSLHVVAVAGGYAFVLPYTAVSEPSGAWVRNVLTTGSAKLQVGDEEFSLVNPRLESFGAARARFGVDDIAQMPLARFGELLLIMDQDHRCHTSCQRRRRSVRCKQCAPECSAVGLER